MPKSNSPLEDAEETETEKRHDQPTQNHVSEVNQVTEGTYVNSSLFYFTPNSSRFESQFEL